MAFTGDCRQLGPEVRYPDLGVLIAAPVTAAASLSLVANGKAAWRMSFATSLHVGRRTAPPDRASAARLVPTDRADAKHATGCAGHAEVATNRGEGAMPPRRSTNESGFPLME
jgi:hypothetical protein